MTPQPRGVTQLLNAWGEGDASAGNELIEVLYTELRRLAARYLQGERPGHTLQPTALVHELYLRFFSSEPIEWRNRGHFMATAARQLRHIIVDYARNQHAQKRGGAAPKLSLDDIGEIGVTAESGVLDLDRALEKLEQLDPRAARVVELRYFGGFTDPEAAEALNMSVATVKRDWDFARTWLLKEIQ